MMLKCQNNHLKKPQKVLIHQDSRKVVMEVEIL